MKAAKRRGETEAAALSPHMPTYRSFQYSPMLERQIAINTLSYTARGKIQYAIEQKKKYEIQKIKELINL